MKKFIKLFLIASIFCLPLGLMASQEDYDIANQSFPSFRADLNNNLGAIATNNSGATEPTTTFPFLLWADTTSGKMKQRNASDTAFIEIWDLADGILVASSVPTGTLSAFAGSISPSDYVFADGSALNSVSDISLADLFILIGTNYGGTGASDFNVPDLRGRALMGLDNLGGVSASRMTNVQADVLGGSGGVESVLLTAAQNGSHTHIGGAHTHAYLKGDLTGALIGGAPVLRTASQTSTATSSDGAVATASSGNGDAHANDQPWLAISIIIKK